MSILEQTKLIELIKDEIENLEYRFEGYKKELYLTLIDILVLERGHLTNKTSIDKRVADKIDALGSFIKLKSQQQ
jgi:hypothetical protein